MMAKQSDSEIMFTMPEAQEYLVSHGVPVRSRSSFYKRIDEHNLPYVDLTPSSRYENRRFRKGDLDKFLETLGFKSPENTVH